MPLKGQNGVESPQKMARRKAEEKGFKVARSYRILWDGKEEIYTFACVDRNQEGGDGFQQ